MAQWPPLPQNRVRGSQTPRFTTAQQQQMIQAGLSYGSPVQQFQVAPILQPQTSSVHIQTPTRTLPNYTYPHNYTNVQQSATQKQQQHSTHHSSYNSTNKPTQSQTYSQQHNNTYNYNIQTAQLQYYNNTNNQAMTSKNNYYGPKPSYGSVQRVSRGKQKTYDLAVKTYETYETAADRDVLCWLYEDKGRCKWGDTCQWLHLDRASGKYLPTVYLTSLDTKRKQQKKMDQADNDITFDRKNVCWEFNTYFGCKKGAKCKWSHRYLVKDATHPFTGEKLNGMAVREFRLQMKRVV